MTSAEQSRCSLYRCVVQASVAESQRWSASNVVIYCVISVLLLTTSVSVCAVTATVKLGRRDLDPEGSTAALCSSDDSDTQLPRQSTTRIPQVLSTTELSPVEQGIAPRDDRQVDWGMSKVQPPSECFRGGAGVRPQ